MPAAAAPGMTTERLPVLPFLVGGVPDEAPGCAAGAAGEAGNFAVVLGRGANAIIPGSTGRDGPLEPSGLVSSLAELGEEAGEKLLVPCGGEEDGGGGNKSRSEEHTSE